jgi:NADP-dependent 3-hydroxy acid dehydrogenase YdfG
LQSEFPEQIAIQTLDVTADNATDALGSIIDKLGGMDVFLLAAGVGFQNYELDTAVELSTATTNVSGFIRMTNAAFDHFKAGGGGHIAVISSIAGTKGLGAAPAYSATKRFQNTYIEALEQLARMEHLDIRFTDIRPGFVATALLGDTKFPMLMRPERVSAHIVRAIRRRKRVATIDIRYRILVFFWRMIPKWLWVRLPIRTK